jgi:hypothetical protein
MGIPADGECDTKALKVNLQLGDPFRVSFDWLGVGALPGSQPFAVYQDVAPPEYPELISEGRTTPAGGAIPKPGTLALLGIGLVGLVVARRRVMK